MRGERVGGDVAGQSSARFTCRCFSATEIFQQSPLPHGVARRRGRRWLSGRLPGQPTGHPSAAIDKTAGRGSKAIGGPLAASEVSK